jgi:hypothetical protein
MPILDCIINSIIKKERRLRPIAEERSRGKLPMKNRVQKFSI